jgi:acyl-coenzyme A thioesterase PaaI-like protein
MLDFAMAFAGFTQLGDAEALSTLTINVVLQKAATAACYDLRGRIDKPGRRVMFASAELSVGGSVIATATSTLLVLR